MIPDLYDAHDLPEPTDSKETSQMTHHTSDSHADLTNLTIETPTLGDRGYLVHDGEVAFVVDPQRDIDRVLDLLDEHQVRLTHVAETHLHNDFVTGGYALAEHTGATYLVNGEDDVSFSRTPVADGDVIEVGERMRLTALATPGHTFTHLSYLLVDTAAEGDQHVGGSFCSATQSDATSSTIGRKQANPVLTQDEQTYVDELLLAVPALA